jgi:glycine oxidase
VAASTTTIIVIGAGVIGCAVAHELARRGAAVQVIDDRPAGMGATQASAGMLAPYVEAREPGPLLDLTACSLSLFDNFVARVVADSGTAVRYRRTGTLDVALGDETLRQLQAHADVLTTWGIEASLLDAHAARSFEPLLSERAIGALHIPMHGWVAAMELTRALVLAAVRSGAQFVERGRALSVGGDGAGLVVRTNQETFRADAVVMAGGSWSGQVEIEGAERAPVRPIRGQLVQLRTTGPSLARVVWGEHCYLVPWDEGTLLVGATVEDVGFDERTTAAGVAGLIEAVHELVPGTRTAEFTAARAGLRPGTPDHLPIIGSSEVLPNLVYATGHYRNGVLLAPLTARVVSDLVLDHHVDPALGATWPQRFGLL